MFEKLRRAKSFIHRSKFEEEKQKYADLDLSETSHLRRNVVIDSEKLKQQRSLNQIKENVSDQKKTTLKRQVSRSNEHLHDQVLEQLRRINFGDSYSKKHAHKLKESGEIPSPFDRRHPAFISERNFRRRSFGVEDRSKNLQNPGKNEKYVVHRNSGDVMSNYDRKNPAYRSESKFGVEKDGKNVQGDSRIGEKALNSFVRKNSAYALSSSTSEVNKGGKNTQYSEKSTNDVQHRVNVDVRSNFDRRNLANHSESNFGVKNSVQITGNTDYMCHKAVEDDLSDFDRNNPALWSEMSIQLIRQKCSEQIDTSTSRIMSSDDDFLLNRKSVDLSYNFDRRSPAYVSDRGARKVKPDVLERSGLKNLIQKVTGARKHHRDKDGSETSSFSSGSASASASSSTSTSIDRNHPAYSSERSCSRDRKIVAVSAKEEPSRKRHYNLTKANLGKNKSTERTLAEECRKKVFDRVKRDGDKT